MTDDAAARMGRIIGYATERFMEQVQGILDDPSGLEPDDFRALRQRATDLQMNLDLLIDQLGTPFEAKRLREKLAGIDR
jgi:hypothetical protein